MYFGHKHVETGPNCSHELATFLKYHMHIKSTYDRFKNVLLKKIHNQLIHICFYKLITASK